MGGKRGKNEASRLGVINAFEELSTKITQNNHKNGSSLELLP